MEQSIYKVTELIQTDPWESLQEFTVARIALGRAGISVPLKETLRFKLDHAHARDAVYSRLSIDILSAQLEVFHLPVLLLHSRATNRNEYLQRPDLGRKLNETSVKKLEEGSDIVCDVAIVLADGLSAAAVQEHAVPLLQKLIPLLASNFSIAFIIVEQGRVAIGDEIGERLQAKLSLVLIGERPGLSSPDSLGAYLTYAPKTGLTDESRNCVSNIRPRGLGYKDAAGKINYLIQQAFKLKISGVLLKDDATGASIEESKR